MVTSAFIQGARDGQEHPLVRGICLEGLAGRANWFKPKNRLDRKIFRVVLDCLHDLDSNVRFWACFAASGMRLLSAKSILRNLMDDDELGDMGITVGYEAGEALKSIQGLPAWEGEPPRSESPYPSLV
jgi:hypothetical protein